MLPSRDDNNLSPEQRTILNLVIERGEVPVQEFVGQIDNLPGMMSSGLVRLKISWHVWGIEYLLTKSSKTPSPVPKGDTEKI